MPVVIPLTIPDAHITWALSAITSLAGEEIHLIVSGEPFEKGHLIFTYPAKLINESNQEIATRVFKDMIVAHMKLSHNISEKQRYASEVEAITPIGQDVPDNIIE